MQVGGSCISVALGKGCGSEETAELVEGSGSKACAEAVAYEAGAGAAGVVDANSMFAFELAHGTCPACDTGVATRGGGAACGTDMAPCTVAVRSTNTEGVTLLDWRRLCAS